MTTTLPDPKPVSAALAAIQSGKAKLAELSTEKTRLETTIAEYLETGDGEDEARLQRIAGFRIRLDMIPHLVTRTENQIEQNGGCLIAAIKGFERELAAVGAAEREALLDRLEKVLKPFAADFVDALTGKRKNTARAIAGQCPVFGAIPVTWDQLAAPHFNHSNHKPSRLQSALDRATGLLSIHAEWMKRRTFIPADHPAAALLDY